MSKLYPSPPGVRQAAKKFRWPMTPAETMLWQRLKNKQLHGLKFRRQHPLHHFILDFYCHAHHFVIEIDGGIHAKQRDYDDARTKWLELRKFRAMRFTNQAVEDDLDGVLEQIAAACGIEPILP